MSNLRVSFYGDFPPQTSPTNFDDAVRTFRNIANLVNNRITFQMVPKTVFLLPLSRIDPNGQFSTLRKISNALISDMVEIMQDIEDAITEGNSLKESRVSSHFDFFSNHLGDFLRSLEAYQQHLRGQFSTIIPEIRGTGRQESELAGLLRQHFQSPFSRQRIRSWINQKTSEADNLRSFMDRLERVPLVPYGSFRGQTSPHEKFIALYLNFPFVEDSRLVTLRRYLRNETISRANTNVNSWVNQIAVFDNITFSIDDFLQYQAANEDNPENNIIFLFTILMPEGYDLPFATIRGFTRQRRRSSSLIFTPPYQPRSLSFANITNGTDMELRWYEPEFGAEFIEQYKVEVIERGTGIIPVKHVFLTGAKVEQFQITVPKRSTSYLVMVRGVCRVGHTWPSDPILHSGIDAKLMGGSETLCPRRANSGRLEVIVQQFSWW